MDIRLWKKTSIIKYQLIKNILFYNEDNEDRNESEKKIEQYNNEEDNEEDNEEIPISK